MIGIGLLGFALGIGTTSIVMLGPLKLRPAAAVASPTHRPGSTASPAATSAASNATASASASASSSSGAQAGAPKPRSRASMAYDEASGKMVVFGGTEDAAYRTPTIFFDDTWTWNGTSWTEEHPSAIPPARVNAGITYDPIHKVVLMWGGFTDHGQSADFWSWNGSTWTQIRPAVFPPAEDNQGWAWPAPILTYDSLHHRVVLIRNNGGHPSYPLPGPDVWTWDGSTWAHPAVANTPALWGTGVYVPALGGIILFGLNTQQAPETWLFDGASWSKRPSVLAPASGIDDPPPMVYFGPARTAALIGDTGDIWSWDGNDWAKQRSSATLPKRMGYSVGVDNLHGLLLTFGGAGPLGIGNSTGPLNQGWTWDGIAWKATR